MKYIRKSLSMILIFAMIALITPVTANAESGVIYGKTTKEQVTSGVTLEKITRFTVDGWYKINVLRADLTNPYVKVDTLIHSETVKKLVNVKDLANASGAVAAVNASFFNRIAGYDPYPDGPIVQDGKIITASNEYNRYSESMASFSLNNLNQVMYNYWKTDIKLIAPNGKTATVLQYNKPSHPNFKYTDFTIWDRKWGTTSLGASQTYPDVVEMVVEGGKVLEIRQAKPAVEIPQNGYVVITRKVGGDFLLKNFVAGDPVNMDIATTPDWKNIKTSLTGSAMLVKDGQIPAKFSYTGSDIMGNKPRTAVGSTQDGKQLIVATVDGNQGSIIGMTLLEMAKLMQELGAYNALNFDGGGSTTIAARPLGESKAEMANVSSDGAPRKISTALGIFSVAPPGELEGLVIDTEDTNMFVNTSRKFAVKGYDKYFNPIAVKPEDVKWSISGLKGSFEGNVLHAKAIGDGKVKAAVGKISAELEISALSLPVSIELSTQKVEVRLNKTASVSATGKNKNGFTAKISPEDLTWKVNGNIGKINKGIFEASGQGTGYLDASLGNAHAYCAVAVEKIETVMKDGFEVINGSFMSYPQGLGGDYLITDEEKHSGNYAGKLYYDFTSIEGTRASYAVFSNDGIKLDSNMYKVGLWVYNDHVNTNWFAAEIYNEAGEKHAVYLAKGMEWTGWKYLEANLEGIKSPERLTRLYVVQTDNISDSGYVYMDDLTFTTSSYPAVDLNTLPKDTPWKDEANKSVVFKKSSTSFQFSVFAQTHEPRNLLEKLLLRRLLDKTASNEAAAFIGKSAHKITKSLKVPFISTDKGYKAFDVKNSRFIQLDTSDRGLRESDKDQWAWFMGQLESAKGSNIFVFMADSPKYFTDRLEANLFQDKLTEYRKKGKNIWVFYEGSTNTSYVEKGIRYISTTGYQIDGLNPSNADLVKHVLVTVNGSTVTFEFKPLV
ncbi:MAG: phosphodiester glycosidase family protein [Clostridia bacterium]|nr:phosphodiester glycosidase family protein [Clostridia bacterium]